MKKKDKEILTKAAKDVTQEKRDRVFYLGNFKGLVDLVDEKGVIKFLTFDKELTTKVVVGGKEYFSPEKVSWLTPRVENVLEELEKHTTTDTKDASTTVCQYCNKTLYPELIAYFKQFSDLPTELHYDYLVWTAFHSHLIEKFNFSPILFLVATKDRGKTPTLKALAYISRRGVFTETFREPNIIRWASDYEASLFFDVRNFPLKVEKSNSEDLIFGRAERGVVSSRVLYPERGAFKDMVDFSVFGLTAATSNVMVDAITEARCIVFNMPFSKKVFNVEATPELGLPYKEKLTAFRMAHFNTSFIGLTKDRAGKLENYLRGYHQMIRTLFPDYEKNFINFRAYARTQKKDEAGSTLESKLLNAVVALQGSVIANTNFLSTQDITTQINLERAEKFWYGLDKIGSELRGLGFKMIRNADRSKRGIEFDPDLIESLAEQYGLEYTNPNKNRQTIVKASLVSEEPKEIKEITETEVEKV